MEKQTSIPMTEHQYEMYLTKTGEPDIDALFWKAIEEEAATLEITVDYYLEEFM
jgi:hypothetical protein